MHLEALPFADQLDHQAWEIEMRVSRGDWSGDTAIQLEISLVYSAVIIRKLWEHYKDLYRDRRIGFDLNEHLSGLARDGDDRPQTALTYVHRIIHSQTIKTGPETRNSGVFFQSDHEGSFEISYDDIVAFVRRAAHATRAIEGQG